MAPPYDEDLAQSQRLFVLFTSVYIYASSVLVVVGFLGNFISFLMLCRAKQKLKIGARKYVIFSAVSNTVYLLLNWYVKTVPLIVAMLGVATKDGLKFMEIVKYNHYACKLVNYLTAAMRFLSVLLTLSFSIERAIAVCFPLKMMVYKQRMAKMSTRLLVGLACFAFSATFCLLFAYDIRSYPGREPECSGSSQFFANSFVALTIGAPVLIIMVANVGIVIAIRRSKAKSEARISMEMGKPPMRRGRELRVVYRKCSDTLLLCRGNPVTRLEMVKKAASYKILNKLKKPRLSCYKTRMLILTTSLYVVLNIPYFVLSFVPLWADKPSPTTTTTTTTTRTPETEVMIQFTGLTFWSLPITTTAPARVPQLALDFRTLTYHCALYVAELMYLLNHSLFFLVLIVSGHRYRRHMTFVLNDFCSGLSRFMRERFTGSARLGSTRTPSRVGSVGLNSSHLKETVF